MSSLAQLMNSFPRAGMVNWIGLRAEKRGPVQVVQQVSADAQTGLTGDRYASRSAKRQVTLIQQEHLAVIAALAQVDELYPETLRRNLVVSGINLLALKGHTFRVGQAILEYTGLCHPCSRMEEVLGEGAYNAMRGHGGITARIVTSGVIAVGDPLTVMPPDRQAD